MLAGKGCGDLRRWAMPASRGSPKLIRVHFERGDEGFLRNLDAAELAHLLLAFLLLVQKLALARDVAAIAFGGHILAQRLDGFARDDLAADRRLHRNLEEVARDEVFE